MKKRIMKLLAAAILLLVIPVTILAVEVTLPELYGDTYYAVLSRMYSRLENADQIRIFVPAVAYPMYRDGYGCETNPWEQYLDRIYALTEMGEN